MSANVTGVEYRLTWRRRSWRRTTANKTRTFHRYADLERFIDKLNAFDPVEHEVHVRDVGPWRA